MACVAGRPATEVDVREGRAVFFVDGTPSISHEMKLPMCAVLKDRDTGQENPVVIIQAEVASRGEIVVGFRYLHGGNGVATLPELELLDGPTDAFR